MRPNVAPTIGSRRWGDNARLTAGPVEDAMNDSLKTLLIIAFLILIVWNLGAGLYYMLVDKGESKRTVNALTRRIALSVGLILLVVLAIKMGWIQPHGINPG
jgi:succinate dehydrogenase/fumarate reductase cytochrome b subunit